MRQLLLLFSIRVAWTGAGPRMGTHNKTTPFLRPGTIVTDTHWNSLSDINILEGTLLAAHHAGACTWATTTR